MTIAFNDNRAHLRELLLDYQPVDDADAAQRERVLAFVESTTECFERSNLAGHVTGSAWVIDKTGTRVLLTHHRKLNKWLQLGGHADGDPNTLAVALREAEEESGLKNIFPISEKIFDLDVHPIPERKSEPAHYHYDIRFIFRADGSEDFVVSDESNELAWVEIKNISGVSKEPSMLRMAEKSLRLTL